MRAILASSIGVACTASLVLPIAAASARYTAADARPAAIEPASGSTQSLRLISLGAGSDRAMVPGVGLPVREVRPFSLVGLVWDDANAELHGTVQVRTRAMDSGAWSGWQSVETHTHEDAADPGPAERSSRPIRGGTAPLWVGASDAVEVRVRPQPAGLGRAVARDPLPEGLRLDLVDPGVEPVKDAPVKDAPAGSASAEGISAGSASAEGISARSVPARGAPADTPKASLLSPGDAASSAVNARLAPLGATVIPAASKARTQAELLDSWGGPGVAPGAQPATGPFIGPRPSIITRKGWGADETLRAQSFVYTNSVKVAFVHHTASGNDYTCAEAPSVLRSIYRYHVVSMGWRDIGYNFVVDKCGNIYEGRAGGVDEPVMGAHTFGFNSNSMGIAVLGTHSSSSPSQETVDAISELTAWKLGLHGGNPEGRASLTSAGGKYAKGAVVKFNVISGHKDGYATACPGELLYEQLGKTRTDSARLQGR
ncbi:N-acetylmuramoyl-L-alanine amidase [Streptomyces sannanensis]|uniref:N-acetylmuramoyl-L-alanine amidase n=1 Tax=Streptomyces sannanensis TaxID=285536 RepID=A0ABP6SAJ8_9ACTN